MELFSEIWTYREMIISLVKRDLKSRYKESVLGFFWMLLNPLLQLCVYTIVFSIIMRMQGIEKYYLYLFVALVPWIFFSTCLANGTTIIIAQQDMVKKIYFPREILPISFVMAQFVNMSLSLIVVIFVSILSGVKIKIEAILYLPVIMIIELILALGITMIMSALTVYFRDLEYIVNIISLSWMYLTPIMYPVEMVPEQFANLFYLNPMTTITIAYREVLYYGQTPNTKILTNAIIMGLIFLILGFFTFHKLQKQFVEEL